MITVVIKRVVYLYLVFQDFLIDAIMGITLGFLIDVYFDVITFISLAAASDPSGIARRMCSTDTNRSCIFAA